MWRTRPDPQQRPRHDPPVDGRRGRHRVTANEPEAQAKRTQKDDTVRELTAKELRELTRLHPHVPVSQWRLLHAIACNEADECVRRRRTRRVGGARAMRRHGAWPAWASPLTEGAGRPRRGAGEARGPYQTRARTRLDAAARAASVAAQAHTSEEEDADENSGTESENDTDSDAERDESTTSGARQRQQQQDTVLENVDATFEATPESRSAWSERIEDIELTTAEKKAARKVVQDEALLLERTRQEVRAQIFSKDDGSGRSPSEKQSVWETVSKLCKTTLLLFRQNLEEQIKAFVSVSESKDLPRQVEEEVTQTVQAKRGWLRKLYESAKTGFVSVVKGVARAVVWSLKAIWSSLKFLVPKATNLGAWMAGSIMANPSTARMSLVIINFLKNRACRQLAVYFTASAEQRESHSLDIDLADPLAMASQLTGPVLVKTVEKMVQKGLTNKVSELAKVGMKAGLSFLGPIGAALTVFTDMAADSMAESSKEALEFYLHYSSVVKSFKEVFDLFDPRSCLREYFNMRAEIQCVLSGTSQTICQTQLKYRRDWESNVETCEELNRNLVAERQRPLAPGEATNARNATVATLEHNLASCREQTDSLMRLWKPPTPEASPMLAIAAPPSPSAMSRNAAGGFARHRSVGTGAGTLPTRRSPRGLATPDTASWPALSVPTPTRPSRHSPWPHAPSDNVPSRAMPIPTHERAAGREMMDLGVTSVSQRARPASRTGRNVPIRKWASAVAVGR